ncbi:MAG: hypothetical protein QNJ63_03835 [Calothrix sp. MO_192.B10]|nr:hypothetical protein [Calothrix sp. MO_192.B10]
MSKIVIADLFMELDHKQTEQIHGGSGYFYVYDIEEGKFIKVQQPDQEIEIPTEFLPLFGLTP